MTSNIRKFCIKCIIDRKNRKLRNLDMKRKIVVASLFMVALLLPMQVAADTISDNYWGAGQNGITNDGSVAIDPNKSGDVFAGVGVTPDKFDVSHMNVNLSGNQLEVSIFSSEYFHYWLGDNTDYAPGDLFLSTTGWNPAGDAASNYNTDNAQNGESWEYVVQLDQIWDFNNKGGEAFLYTVDGPIGMGSQREDQESFYIPGNQQASQGLPGLWEYRGDGNNGTDPNNPKYNELFISITLSDPFMAALGEELGLHWGMDCGNDIIEGGYMVEGIIPPNPVPEPSTLLLFGAGLVGLAGLKRRK